MNTLNLFENKIKRLEKLFIIKTIKKIFFIALLIFLSIYTTATVIEKTGIFNFLEYLSFYIISIIFSLAFSCVYTFLKRETFLDGLIDIDMRLKLMDRVSTAYEYQKMGEKSELAGLLMKDAGHRLNPLSRRQLFPQKFTFIHLMISILIFTCISLSFVGNLYSVSKEDEADQEKLERIGLMLQDFSEKKDEDLNRKGKKSQRKAFKKMKDIARKLDNRSISRKQLFGSLNKILKEVESDQTRLTSELGSKLESNSSDVSIPKTPESEKSSSNTMRNLKKMIQMMFKKRVPGSIKDDLARLDENQGLKEFLMQIMDDIKPGNNLNKPGSGGRDKIAKNNSGMEKDGRNVNDADADRNLSGTEQDDKDTDDLTDAGPAADKDGYNEAPKMFNPFSDIYSHSAGRAKSEEKKHPQYKLEKPKSRILYDRTLPSGDGNYNTRIRSLTTIGRAKLKMDDITRSYRQEIENVLQKEDIPLNYREYIKNYFISIGLRREKNTDGKTK